MCTAHGHISFPDKRSIRFPTCYQAVYLDRLDQQEDRDTPQHGSTQITGWDHQQAEDRIGRQDVTVVHYKVQDTKSEQEEHAPCKAEGEVLALLLLVVPHDEEAESEEDGEYAVHLAREQDREDVEDHTVAGKRAGNPGREEVEMLHRVVQDNADHGKASKGIRHLDTAVFESLGLIHISWFYRSEDKHISACLQKCFIAH